MTHDDGEEEISNSNTDMLIGFFQVRKYLCKPEIKYSYQRMTFFKENNMQHAFHVPFSQIGCSVPQPCFSTKESAIMTSKSISNGLYELFSKTESQSLMTRLCS